MFRGRGYRGGGQPNPNYRGGPQGMRGGFQPGRPLANKKEALKFEKDYDFEEANKEFSEVLQKLQVCLNLWNSRGLLFISDTWRGGSTLDIRFLNINLV